jgi:hypothetical protein
LFTLLVGWFNIFLKVLFSSSSSSSSSSPFGLKLSRIHVAMLAVRLEFNSSHETKTELSKNQNHKHQGIKLDNPEEEHV